MKKEGIQTRNRKLSSKGKKKKGNFGLPDGILKPLDPSKTFGGFHPSPGQLSAMSSMSAMSAVNHWAHNASAAANMSHLSAMSGSPFAMPSPAMHMGSGSGHHTLSTLSLTTSTMNLGLPNSMVGAMA